ncbi:MAG: AAA family ATPase, partial [Candidatus Tectomicrobia bacterium]
MKLQPKVFDLLAYLLQHRDRVMTRQTLFEHLWPEQFVSDDALERAVATARRAVGDSGRTQEIIKTVQCRGYRFIASVVEDQDMSDAASLSMPASAALSLATTRHDAQHAIDSERKQVTVLACALDPTQEQAEGLEPEALYTLRQHVFTLCQRAVQQYGGTIQHFVDEGFLAFFGVPVAQEDHARRAVLAAWRIHNRLHQSSDGTAFIPYRIWMVRLGLHTGDVVVGRIGDDPRRIALALGDTTQVANQLLRLATPGEIVLSQVTARLVHGGVRLAVVEPGRNRSLVGLPPAYKVVDVLPQRPTSGWQGRRTLRQFVGREGDLAKLQSLLAQVEEGYGQVIGITGEPGIGKSRLLYEFHRRVHPRPLTYLTGRCESYGQATPYRPLLDIFRQACGLSQADALEAGVTKVDAYLEALGLESELWAPYVRHLLGLAEEADLLTRLGPQAMRHKTFEVLRLLSLHASRQRPLVLEIEDLHWIDPTSEQWLMTLVERLSRAPILLLVSYRPGYRPPWIDKSYVTQLSLQRLTNEESRRVVQAICHPAPA